jgi:hypothetical protein
LALPAKQEEICKGRVLFGTENSWGLVVEYYYNGVIDNYYLTNIPG